MSTQNLQTKPGRRIEYIDAMRGFTMILVVYSHICNMCLGEKWMGFNDFFSLFRLPCFFFISGWLFEPSREHRGDRPHVWSTLRHKFMVQIVPTTIFLLLLAPPPLFFSRLGATKGGYWFTFALFVFFAIHLFISWLVKKLPTRYQEIAMLCFALTIAIASYLYEVFYNQHFSHLGWVTSLLGFLSFRVWRFYLFFCIGALVKRHFSEFIRWMDNNIGCWKRGYWAIVVFVGMYMIPHTGNIAIGFLRFAIGGIAGMWMIFNFFRWRAAWFNSNTRLGHSLIYIGTRTLNIYLLHYFLLPRFLLPFGSELRGLHLPVLEFVVALALALIVVALCLGISYIICLNSTLAHYLFGMKKNTKKFG